MVKIIIFDDYFLLIKMMFVSALDLNRAGTGTFTFSFEICKKKIDFLKKLQCLAPSDVSFNCTIRICLRRIMSGNKAI